MVRKMVQFILNKIKLGIWVVMCKNSQNTDALLLKGGI